MLKKISAIFIFVTLLFTAEIYTVKKVVDGDTFELENGEKVRLLCVNTPESVHPRRNKNSQEGIIAGKYTQTRLEGKAVDLKCETAKKYGRFGRLLAYCFIDGKNFNLELVEKGYSCYYTKYGKSEYYHDEFLKSGRKCKGSKCGILEKWQVESGYADKGRLNITERIIWC
ncbi:MAG: thermonuclease family protein [bacterium]